jgi:hypothetical protein
MTDGLLILMLHHTILKVKFVLLRLGTLITQHGLCFNVNSRWCLEELMG